MAQETTRQLHFPEPSTPSEAASHTAQDILAPDLEDPTTPRHWPPRQPTAASLPRALPVRPSPLSPTPARHPGSAAPASGASISLHCASASAIWSSEFHDHFCTIRRYPIGTHLSGNQTTFVTDFGDRLIIAYMASISHLFNLSKEFKRSMSKHWRLSGTEFCK